MNDCDFVPLVTQMHMKRILADPQVRDYIDRYGIEEVGDEIAFLLKLEVFREFCAREFMMMPTDVDDKTAEQFMDYLETNNWNFFKMITTLMKTA